MSTFRVDAESPQDAIEMVREGRGSVDGTEYSHDRPEDEWKVYPDGPCHCIFVYDEEEL